MTTTNYYERQPCDSEWCKLYDNIIATNVLLFFYFNSDVTQTYTRVGYTQTIGESISYSFLVFIFLFVFSRSFTDPFLFRLLLASAM